jgi:hypothetical protein
MESRLKRFFLFLVVFMTFISSISYAEERAYPRLNFDDTSNIKIDDFKAGGFFVKLNLYLDAEYTDMDAMPVVAAVGGVPQFAKVDDHKNIALNHSHVILDAENKSFRLHINFEAENIITGGDDEELEAEEEFLEYYVEYTVSDSLKIRAGKILAPFGIYSDIRHFTPLYSNIILPTIYEPPHNYDGEPFYPPDANLMVSGIFFLNDNMELYYGAYYGTGKKGDHEMGFRSIPSIGGRLTLALYDTLTLGVSGFTFENEGVGRTGQEDTFAMDLELKLLDDDLKFQAEYAKTGYDGLKDRSSYYANLMYTIGRFTPFVLYNEINDREDFLFKHKMSLTGVGASIRVTNNVYFKGEYHLHKFLEDTAVLENVNGEDLTESEMFLFSVNLVF